MKLFHYFLLCTGLLTACTSEPTIVPEHAEYIDTNVYPIDSVLLCQAHLDGMFDEFYVYAMNEDTLTPDITEIHIVPDLEYQDLDSSETDDIMFGIVSTGFDVGNLLYLNGQTFSGIVRVFYDANCAIPVVEYTVVENEPHGPLKVYSPDGELIISRIYENGICTASTQDLYAIDWTFDPSTAALELQRFADYKKTDADGNTLIELGESMHPNTGPYKNYLYEMLQKPVFENAFTVNGQPFTGTLKSYYPYTIYGDDMLTIYFEMVFLEGKLNDTIRLYSEGELQLEERFENGTLVETIYEMDYSEMDGMAKPVIYLYPEKDMAVNVQVDLKGQMTHSYPTYPQGGWDVLAKQNGTLYDLNGKEYYALFWEGASSKNYTLNEGFVVKGSETATFLENSLDVLGLTRREANEFIMYWLPQMENNAYNLIHFSTDEYNDIAELTVTPKPESMIRIMMVWSPLDAPVEIPQQNLYDLRTERTGFTVVEWGGKLQSEILVNLP